VLAASRNEAFDAIGPIGAAAEQPRDHEARTGNRLDIEIDREIVAEPQDRREPQARGCRVSRPKSLLRRSEQRNLGIGARQQHNVPWALREIDRGRAIGDHP